MRISGISGGSDPMVRLSRPQAAVVGLLGLALFTLYMFFDLREAEDQNLATTKITSVSGLQHMYGLWYMVAVIVLNALLALVSAVLAVQSFALIKARRRSGATGACSAGASVLVGFGVFGCPSCTVPLLGTLGLTAAASSLPLKGIEFKFVALIVIVFGLWWLRRRAVSAGS